MPRHVLKCVDYNSVKIPTTIYLLNLRRKGLLQFNALIDDGDYFKCEWYSANGLFKYIYSEPLDCVGNPPFGVIRQWRCDFLIMQLYA